MKKFITVFVVILSCYNASAQYDNSEKLTLLGGFTSTGSEFVFWSDNVYGGNVQLLYDVKKYRRVQLELKLPLHLQVVIVVITVV